MAEAVEAALKNAPKWQAVEGGSNPSDEVSMDEGKENANAKLEREYIQAMGPLQYAEVEKFDAHHYKTSATSSNPATITRILLETGTWASGGLPLSLSSSVFLRKCESDMTLLQALITGPQGTPYANGCFIFDIMFTSEYPHAPPKVNLRTTGNGTVRFNPNLYNEGKVCLSLLGTWSGDAGESWTKSSTLLQVLVSIQSLILVEMPYFNEPGFERTMGTREGDINNQAYNAYLRLATIKFAMSDHLRNPNSAFKDVIVQHFKLKKGAIKELCKQYLTEADSYTSPQSGYVTGFTKDDYKNQLKSAVESLTKQLDAL